MPQRPASEGGARSDPRRAAVPAAMSLASRLRRIAMHAPPPGTSKRPPSNSRPQGPDKCRFSGFGRVVPGRGHGISVV